MIGLINLTGLGIFALLLCATHGQELISNEVEARNFLTETSNTIFMFFDELTDKEFYFDVHLQRNHNQSNQNYINFLNQIVADTRKFDFENFNDEDLKYTFKVLVQLADENIIGVNRRLKILELLRELDLLPYDKKIAQYDPRNIYLVYSPDVEEIIENSSNEDEIQHYWSSWRIMNGKWAKDNLNLVIQGLKDAAKMNELSPLEFWSRGFNITDMEDLVWQIQPLYREFHTFIRKVIRNKFGSTVIKRDRLIPAHLFDQVEMTIDSIIEELFPPERNIKLKLKDKSAVGLYEKTEDFFEGIGFERFPERLWLKHTYLSNNGLPWNKVGVHNDDDDDDDQECQSRVIYKTPNPYLFFCEKMSFTDFLESYRNLAYVHYAKEMVGLPAYFFSAPQDLDHAIGKAMMLSASSQPNVKKVDLIDDIYIPEGVELNRLLQWAWYEVMNVPLDFVHAKVMADLLSGEIEMKDLNNHYWGLLSRYAGIKKPEWHEIKSEVDIFDFPVKFYKQMSSNEMSREFTTEILSFQIHKKLCELSGSYPKEPLHLCDISESKDAGNALKKMMKLGKSKPFYQVLATLFPDNQKISAEGLLEYFKPVIRMVQRKNKELNLKVGWETASHRRSRM
ncbi:angiotensin-converting enzyme-like [Episyrphus balteatus]|uniref:angiotensin-converting enzyme-like n=1 Tax=Episyrphus balteatus TaxID=286459 RepID=UPI002485212B|nr:angiotensin-converting enzyme-like [Episyrphus balteatus]